jgi:hypothetical protein
MSTILMLSGGEGYYGRYAGGVGGVFGVVLIVLVACGSLAVSDPARQSYSPSRLRDAATRWRWPLEDARRASSIAVIALSF